MAFMALQRTKRYSLSVVILHSLTQRTCPADRQKGPRQGMKSRCTRLHKPKQGMIHLGSGGLRLSPTVEYHRGVRIVLDAWGGAFAVVACDLQLGAKVTCILGKIAFEATAAVAGMAGPSNEPTGAQSISTAGPNLASETCRGGAAPAKPLVQVRLASPAQLSARKLSEVRGRKLPVAENGVLSCSKHRAPALLRLVVTLLGISQSSSH